jgi:ABC-type glycerol-3-phosphate transport system substrate-binding protein
MYYNKTLLKKIGYVDEHGNARPPVNRAEFMDVLRKLRPKPGASHLKPPGDTSSPGSGPTSIP